MKYEFEANSGLFEAEWEKSIYASLDKGDDIELILKVAAEFDKDQAFAYYKVLHKVLFNREREDLIGDVMMAYARIHDQNGSIFARNLAAIEAASSYEEHDRIRDAEAVLEWIEPSLNI